MAKVLRWRVLANRKFSVRETDLILGGESLLNLVTLMRDSMRKPLTLTVCICWVGKDRGRSIEVHPVANLSFVDCLESCKSRVNGAAPFPELTSPSLHKHQSP